MGTKEPIEPIEPLGSFDTSGPDDRASDRFPACSSNVSPGVGPGRGRSASGADPI